SSNGVVYSDGAGANVEWKYINSQKCVFSLPGRLMVEGLGNIPFIAQAFGIQASAATGYASFHSLLATALNLLFWVGCLVLVTRIGADRPAAQAATDESAGTADIQHYRGPKAPKT